MKTDDGTMHLNLHVAIICMVSFISAITQSTWFFQTDFSICFTIKYTSLTNSPCLFHRKCKENSVENINTNVLGC